MTELQVIKEQNATLIDLLNEACKNLHDAFGGIYGKSKAIELK